MASQHRDLHLRLDDAEKLWRYTQFAIYKHKSIDDALGKARAKSKYWEHKAKEGTESTTEVENERDEAKEEAQVARLAATTTGNAKARVEVDMARVQDALEVAKEARHKAEVEAAHLEVERTSLLLEIGAAKDEVSSLHSQASNDKEAMEKDYHKALELIFAHGYGELEVPDGILYSSDPLSPEFFMNPRCPPASAATEAKAVEANPSEAAKEPEESASVRDLS